MRVDDRFPDELAVECLWDCEAETRETAAHCVALTSTALHRLRTIADDAASEPSLREEAAKRLVCA